MLVLVVYYVLMALAAILAALFGFGISMLRGYTPLVSLGISLLSGGAAALVVYLVKWGIDRLGGTAALRLVIEALLILIVAFTCLALGGAPRWTWTILEIAAALAVILWGVRMLLERRIAWVKTPLNLLLIALLLYTFFQLLPLPAPFLRVFQPNTLRVNTVGPPSVSAAAAQPLTAGGWFPVSMNRDRTRGHLFLFAAYVAFFLVFINNITSRAQLGRMIGAILVVVSVTAVSGFATVKQPDERMLYRRWPIGGPDEKPYLLNADANPEFSAGYGFVFPMHEGDAVDFFVPKTHGGDVYGGFPSSNSAATVLVMGLVLAVGALTAYISTWRSEWGQSGGLLYTREGNITLLLVFIIVLTIAGLGITRSRAGIGVAAVCVPAVILLAAFSRSWVAGLLTLGVLAALVIVPLAVLGPAEVKGLIAERAGMWLNPFEEDTRFLGRQSTWNMIGDFPMFGTGLGTYSSVYPAYKVRGPMLYFAHCDSLQWFAETGLVGLILAGAALVTAVWTAVAGWFRIKEPFFRRLLLGTALACVAFLAHGLVDFPLAIPGVAVVFVALAASTLVIARDQVARHEENDFTF